MKVLRGKLCENAFLKKIINYIYVLLEFNTLQMDLLKHKPQIAETFQMVRNFSFEEKREALYDEKKINKLLDTILEFKKAIAIKTAKIEALVEKIEKITWFNQLDKESLMLINDLISSIRDLHSSLLRQYISLNFIRSKGVAKNEIKNFKDAIDDLKDVANDLNSRFFFLSNNDEFQETTKQLSLL